MSGAAATAATAAANAALAAQQSAQKSAECAISMPGFQHDGSTVKERKAYAECVRHVYPDDMSPAFIANAKVCVAVLLLAVLAGAVLGGRDDGEWVAGGLAGLCLGGAAIFTYFAIVFVFS